MVGLKMRLIMKRADHLHKEIKVSGIIRYFPNDNQANIALDCGGVISIEEIILTYFGCYNDGDKITITINPCGENEFYYPKFSKNINELANGETNNP